MLGKKKKISKGYHGFITQFDSSITLEDDLRRRDLTINSIAKNVRTGEIIDPFNGQDDLKNKVLRHTSEAFSEDPVRALRLARLCARYDFMYATSTRHLVHNMVDSGELDFLTAERVFKEFEKAFKDNKIDSFVENLLDLRVLTRLFPEVSNLRKVLAGPNKYHGEGSAFVHTMMVVSEASKYDNSLVTFGALVHDLGKAVTSKEVLPSHPGHEEAGVPIVESFCNRLKMPSEYRRVGVLCARHHGHVHKTFEMNGKSFVKIYNDFNRGHFEHDLDILVKVSEADHFGRISVDNKREDGYPEGELFKRVLKAVHAVKLSNFFTVEEIKEMKPDVIKQKFHQLKCSAAKKVFRDTSN